MRLKKYAVDEDTYPRFNGPEYLQQYATLHGFEQQRCLDWFRDFLTLDTHGFMVQFDRPGYAWITTPYIELWIERRNVYCNRGRYGVVIETYSPEIQGISEHQLFPRYFFNLQRLFDEMDDWFTFANLPRQPVEVSKEK